MSEPLTVPDLTTPITREQVEALILWDRFPYDRIPTEQRGLVLDYHHAIVGIEDCFGSLDGDSIRDIATYAVSLDQRRTEAGQADLFVTAHFGMLDQWRDALDHLDSELRSHVAEGSLPDWAAELVKLEAFGLFSASYALLRAVAEYHHGTAGPSVEHDHDFAFVLSNSVVNPFTPMGWS